MDPESLACRGLNGPVAVPNARKRNTETCLGEATSKYERSTAGSQFSVGAKAARMQQGLARYLPSFTRLYAGNCLGPTPTAIVAAAGVRQKCRLADEVRDVK